jgi:hypothetical protein
MSDSAWGDRWRRSLMLLRSPWLFATAASYRAALFKGMLQGEILVRNGVRSFVRRPGEREAPLRLVLRGGPPSATLLVSSIAFDVAPSDEGRQACAIVQALLERRSTVRLVATAKSSFPDEARVRAWLQAQGVLAPSAQALLEIIDGTAALVPVNADDAFIVAAGPAWVSLLRERLDGRSSKARVHVLVASDGESVAPGVERLVLPPDATPQQTWEALAPIAAGVAGKMGRRFAAHSRLGIGYEILKPLGDGHIPRRTCLFVHFDPDGTIDPHVLRYLSALKTCGMDTVLISNIGAEAFAAADPLTVAAVTRQNKGLDFSGWALAMELFPSLLQSESLLIANDSVYGPVGDLRALFDRMDSQPFDLWGAIESRDIEQHFQSWFICFRRAALRSEVFAKFWSGVLPLDDKRAVIEQYEMPLWRTFEAAGLSVGVAVPWEGHELIDNPALEGWRALLELGAPFVKVQLLRDNPRSVDLDGWAAELRARGYPADLVVDHLYRVTGAGAAALKAD